MHPFHLPILLPQTPSLGLPGDPGTIPSTTITHCLQRIIRVGSKPTLPILPDMTLNRHMLIIERDHERTGIEMENRQKRGENEGGRSLDAMGIRMILVPLPVAMIIRLNSRRANLPVQFSHLLRLVALHLLFLLFDPQPRAQSMKTMMKVSLML